MALFSFLPKSPNFFRLFSASGVNAVDTARALLDLFERFENVEAKVRRIRELEHEGDRLSHELTNALTTTFLTPFDREDIIDLGENLDDFVDYMEEAARRAWLYRIHAPTAQAQAFARVLVRQAELIARGLPLLEDAKRHDELQKIVIEVKTLEDEGDRLYDEVEADLYENVGDVKSLVAAMRWGELYNLLEDATDQAQRVAKTIEGILLKHA
ncbi:DUF47 domain-containing protein [Deinococcus yavapaiensis]|uniref:Phosphate transport regulator n=1 Tax=Deinococcus yavapaiensis KR-236 TaxID=694435 RepID=A0A318S940_9DEIO|nr:DUF47 domain-containing protein [Deinococcus yavapaiensis]PYE52717.1 hypothetical protein DES52_11238 [Deinococcus yavapaiensis KR-236]